MPEGESETEENTEEETYESNNDLSEESRRPEGLKTKAFLSEGKLQTEEIVGEHRIGDAEENLSEKEESLGDEEENAVAGKTGICLHCSNVYIV